MPDDGAPNPSLGKKLADMASDVFEEAKVMFFGAVACLWASLALCHALREMGAFSPLATAVTMMFTGLVAKMAWGKD